MVLFKRRRGEHAVSSKSDEEKGASDNSARATTVDITEVVNVEKSDFRSSDIFSWHHVDYVVPVGNNEQRRLLDDVSGYVAPGKLTALMGESGSGKVRVSCTEPLCRSRGIRPDNSSQRACRTDGRWGRHR